MNIIDVGRSISILNRRSQAIITAACEPLKLSYSEYAVILQLYESEGKSQDELANLLQLDKAVVTRTISLLEKKNLIRREKDKRDKRINHIYLTELAKTQKKFLNNILETWMLYLVAKLTDEERDIFFKGIVRASDRACKTPLRDFVDHYANIKDGK